jgi:hypothetical protein
MHFTVNLFVVLCVTFVKRKIFMFLVQVVLPHPSCFPLSKHGTCVNTRKEICFQPIGSLQHFSISTFCFGILAILSGVVADIGADWLSFGPVAPFMTAIPFLIASAVLISLNWQENHGKFIFIVTEYQTHNLVNFFNK